VHKWGFELEDLYLLGACSCVLLVALALVPLPGFDSPFVWAGCTVVVFAVAYYGKRGKPPGAIRHWLHEMELWGIPGMVSPREDVYSPW
jgi:hypothetical protein